MRKKGMPVLCYIYRVDISEEDSCTHTQMKNTQAYLHVYVFIRTVT